MAIATGELNQDELKRKTERDLRSLYVRFKNSTTAPTTEREIYQLDKLIKDVRIPRQAKNGLKYCFMEFSDEQVCQTMKTKLAANPDLLVDYVGVKSKSRTTGTAKKRPINPTRLHVSGFSQGITSEKLKALFPKCTGASVPAKNSYGFVQFDNPADAKAAFDATQKLKVGDNQHITVVFARLQKHGSVIGGSKHKAPKRKVAKSDSEDAKKPKVEEDKQTDEASDEDDNENEAEEEAEASGEDEEVANDEESEGGEEAANDEESENDAAEAEESDEEAEGNEEESDDEDVENDEDDSDDDEDE